MLLNSEDFKNIVLKTPLVSIDLVVQNSNGEVLLGQRLNRPAQGFWFVPGGRILKNETLDTAFQRISVCELGEHFIRRHARLLGVYEHFYSDSVFGEAGNAPDTHYVVIGYHLVLRNGQTLVPPRTQHEHYCWWSIDDMQSSEEVHANTRAYLNNLR